MQMRFAHFVRLLYLPIVQTANLTSLSALRKPLCENKLFQNRLNNSTFGVPLPPDSFNVTFEIGGPPLRKTPCLLNTVAALKTLALGSFRRRIPDGTEYTSNSYPDVSIAVTTRDSNRSRSLEARFVIWAIVFGVHQMVDEKKFELAQFEITWDGEVLGWVHIVNNLPSLALTSGENPADDAVEVAKRSSRVPSSNATSVYIPSLTYPIRVDVDDPDDARLNTTFNPIGDKLGIYDVLFPVIDSLSDMAARPATDQIDCIVAGYENTKGVICILRLIDPGGGPPFLEYQWLIRAISRIPSYMVENSRFGELEMTMAVDGVEVGFGKLTDNGLCF